MNLIKRFKKRKQEELKNEFYNYIENAKHNIKMGLGLYGGIINERMESQKE